MKFILSILNKENSFLLFIDSFDSSNILDLRIEVPGNARPTLSNPTCIGEYTYIHG